jgi:hypothetical protein
MIPTITRHGLDKIDSSPLDYWFHYLNPYKPEYVPDKNTLFDNAFRLAVFNFDKFKFLYSKIPKLNLKTNIGKAEFESLTEAANSTGKLLISDSDYNKIILMRNEILKHPTASKLCQEDKLNGKFEHHEKQSDVIIKFTPHYVNPIGVIVNLSSTDDACENNFQKEAWNFRHDKRAAIYMDGTGLNNMVFITVEKSEPFKVGVRYLDQRSIDLGRETYLKNCATYAECCKTGVWVGIDPKITESSLPEWAFKNR